MRNPIERLEERRLLSAVYYDADSTSIKVHGTAQADRVTVIHRGDRILVQLNDRRRWFDDAGVTWIDLATGGGNDLVDTRNAPYRVTAFTEDGSDTVLCGAGDDIVYGGLGADRIDGGAGDDELRGEGGRDRIIGAGGDDTLSAAGGDDQITGGAGDDYFLADAGNPLLDGGDGADIAVHYSDRGRLRSIEGQSYYQQNSPDPFTHLSVGRNKDGVIFLLVTATHFQSGYKNHFADALSRNGRTFGLNLTGEDLVGPGAGRFQALQTERQSYRLGKLADGTWSVNVGSNTFPLATITITVAGGVPVNTPTWTGPYQSLQGVIVD